MAALTQYARRKWREAGYQVHQGEFISRGGGHVRRQDVFGFGDLLCVADWGSSGELVILQVTSWGNVSARCNKIARECRTAAEALLAVPGVRIVVEGWEKKDEPGEDGRWWQSREIEMTYEEIQRRQR